MRKRKAVAPQLRTAVYERSVVGGTGGTDKSLRGYRVDYPKLKTLCRQAGLKIVDLYEPGVIPKQLISEGTLKKWRRGGRAMSDSLLKVAEALSEQLRWRVDWRELTEAQNANRSFNSRLAVLPFHAPATDRLDGEAAAGFRSSMLAQLSKLRGLRVVSAPALEFAPRPRTADAALGVDAVLNGSLRTHGDLGRLDVELTNTTSREVLWANSYPFAESDLLRAQTAIAAEVSNQIGRILAAAGGSYPDNPLGSPVGSLVPF